MLSSAMRWLNSAKGRFSKETTMWTLSKHPVAILLLSGVPALAVLCPPVLAARITLSYDNLRQTSTPIVLAEVTGAKAVSRPWHKDPNRIDHGYDITLKVHEVLRGDLKSKTIEIPFSPKGYSRTWEDDAPPTKGMKVLAFLASGQGDKWNDYGLPGTIRVLKTFDDAVVKTLRKVLAFWAITPEEKQEEALRQGCFDNDLGFRLYCVYVLHDRALHSVPQAAETLSFLWQVYTDPRTDLDTWQACDNAFWNKYRPLGWKTYEPRYAILHSLVERTWNDEANSPYQSVNWALLSLAGYPNHRPETFALLSTIADGSRPNMGFGAATYLGYLYEFFPAGDEQRALNAKVLAKLKEWMAGGPHSDTGASDAASLLRESVMRGVERQDLIALARQAVDGNCPKSAKNLVSAGLRDFEQGIRKMRPLPEDQSPPIVQDALAQYIGKTVRVIGQASWERTPEYGAALEVDHRLIWLPDMEKWPFDFPPDKYIVAKGKVVQKDDMPVFRYEKGKPFGDGLPVPQPYGLKEMSQRFVLKDATWEFIESGGK
jgi:hypothetical protein